MRQRLLLRWLLVLLRLLLGLMMVLLLLLLLLLAKQNRRGDEWVRGGAGGRKRNGRCGAVFVGVWRIGPIGGNHNLAFNGERRRQLFEQTEDIEYRLKKCTEPEKIPMKKQWTN